MKTHIQSEVSPFERAKNSYYSFSAFNVLSFNFISGNIITLYVLRLGAGNSIVGLFSAFTSMALVFTLMGRFLVRRMGAVRLAAIFWTIRYLLMAPALLTLLPSVRNNVALALFLIGLGVISFNISRGIAMAGNQSMVGEITSDRDRGSFLAKNQLIVYTLSIGTSLAMAFMLGKDAPLFMYGVFISAGILTGLVASYFLSRLPEPKEARKGYEINMGDAVRAVLSSVGFKRLLIVAFFNTFAISLVAPFLIVFFKAAYGQSDSNLIFFTVASSVGAIMMALLSGVAIDRVGSKPLYFTFAVIVVVSLVPIVLVPTASSAAIRWSLPVIIFFLFGMGSAGSDGSSSTYFFATTRPDERLNFGIIYNLTKGAAGFVGATLGGVILQLLQSSSELGSIGGYRLYFGVMGIGLAAVCFLVTRLPDIGSYSIQDVLSIIFSPKDFRALTMLRKLDQSRTIAEEQHAVESLGQSSSALSREELIKKLKSPSLFIRTEALRALRNHKLDAEIEQLLVTEVKNHRYTTAHLAAETLGAQGTPAAIPALRQALRSDDYYLAGKSMVSLARLGDRESLPRIESTIRNTINPGLVIYGARALEIFGDLSTIPTIIARLAKKPYPYLRDELILSMAGIYGFVEWFYQFYTLFAERSTEGTAALSDYLHKGNPGAPSHYVDAVNTLLSRVSARGRLFSSVASKLLVEVNLPALRETSRFLIGALRNEKLLRLERFRFFIVALIIWGMNEVKPSAGSASK